jgi:hypothetical protein
MKNTNEVEAFLVASPAGAPLVRCTAAFRQLSPAFAADKITIGSSVRAPPGRLWQTDGHVLEAARKALANGRNWRQDL